MLRHTGITDLIRSGAGPKTARHPACRGNSNNHAICKNL